MRRAVFTLLLALAVLTVPAFGLTDMDPPPVAAEASSLDALTLAPVADALPAPTIGAEIAPERGDNLIEINLLAVPFVRLARQPVPP